MHRLGEVTMNVIHVMLMTLSGAAFAVTVVAGATLRRASGGAQLQSVGLATAGALVIGNAVCALPGTPTWYASFVVAATVAGLGWLVTILTNAVGAALGAPPQGSWGPLVVAGRGRPQLVAVQPPLASVHLLHPAPAPTSARPELVTARDLHEFGPAGSRNASSGTVYVATNLGAYVRPSSIERRNRALNHQRRDPVEALRRLRVTAAYNHTPARENRVRRSL